MPRKAVPLSDAKVRAAKPQDKPYKLFDGQGLYIEISPAGGKLWRWKYYFQGKEKRLALGRYPAVSIAAARGLVKGHQEVLGRGMDPAEERVGAYSAPASPHLEDVAREWFDKFRPKWTQGHAETILARLANNVFPYLGNSPISTIAAPDLLPVLRRIEARGAMETAHRVRGILSQVFCYAVACGYCDRDPAADLRNALAPAVVKPMAAFTTAKDVAGLLRAIDDFRGTPVVRAALQLAPLTMVRPGELRHAEWTEFALDTAEAPTWSIPAGKMKMRRDHIVPLSRQAVAVLQDLQPWTGHGRYVFPSARTASGSPSERPMSENAVLAALRRMGFSRDEMTGHGFRAMATTLLVEAGWEADLVDLQLAHAPANKVKAAYNRANRLEDRRRLLQAWADMLDGLRGRNCEGR
ncbi:tyrosine-type recombinase/integrase [Megalodesulfovibrio gigas]|uniref:tyrosine-type recombinase/integrase n=2 Tax=Megalodesulfovibrio gigas TaxID=879 RepID=UPI000404ECE9|nr:integrase arm-type DNA-binding domain-containing protein [Megalodesulfovibrio gigas]